MDKKILKKSLSSSSFLNKNKIREILKIQRNNSQDLENNLKLKKLLKRNNIKKLFKKRTLRKIKNRKLFTDKNSNIIDILNSVRKLNFKTNNNLSINEKKRYYLETIEKKKPVLKKNKFRKLFFKSKRKNMIFHFYKKESDKIVISKNIRKSFHNNIGEDDYDTDEEILEKAKRKMFSFLYNSNLKKIIN